MILLTLVKLSILTSSLSSCYAPYRLTYRFSHDSWAYPLSRHSTSGHNTIATTGYLSLRDLLSWFPTQARDQHVLNAGTTRCLMCIETLTNHSPSWYAPFR